MTDPTLLLIDDDLTFCHVLQRALGKRGYAVTTAHSVDEALQCLCNLTPQYAIVDLKMPGQSGLALIQQLKMLNPAMRILVLTGFASIATAVEAIKLGATHYLAKPADADEIIAALHRATGDDAIPVRQEPLSVNRLEWEHIQKVLAEHDGNISATARALKMHRRSLQRKLTKKPTQE
jgi:two-component system response regulator RegA